MELNLETPPPTIPLPSRRVYTAKELAPLFNVSEQWLLRRTRKAIAGLMVVPHIRVGKMIRFRLEDVQRYFDKHFIQ
jgi:hypothetical protein